MVNPLAIGGDNGWFKRRRLPFSFSPLTLPDPEPLVLDLRDDQVLTAENSPAVRLFGERAVNRRTASR